MERRKRKKKQREQKYITELTKQNATQNLVDQLDEQYRPTFDKSAWQASPQSRNIQHGSVRSAVLNREADQGFDKTAWEPSGKADGKHETKTIKSGFDLAAWTPDDNEKTS